MLVGVCFHSKLSMFDVLLQGVTPEDSIISKDTRLFTNCHMECLSPA